MKRLLSVLAVVPIMSSPSPAQAQVCNGSPGYPCDDLTHCTPCPPENPEAEYSGEGEEVRPSFEQSPGGERGVSAVKTLFPALGDLFDFGSELNEFDVPQDEVDEWADG